MARPGACRPEASCVGPPLFEHTSVRATLPTFDDVQPPRTRHGKVDRSATQYTGRVIYRGTSNVTVNMSDRGTIATFVALSLISAGLVAMAFLLP